MSLPQTRHGPMNANADRIELRPAKSAESAGKTRNASGHQKEWQQVHHREGIGFT